VNRGAVNEKSRKTAGNQNILYLPGKEDEQV